MDDMASGRLNLRTYMQALAATDAAKWQLLTDNWDDFLDFVSSGLQPWHGRHMRRPTVVEMRGEALDQLALQTFRILGYVGMENSEWPSAPSDGPCGLRRSLSPH